jgi:toxin ParE1/3/4
VNVPVSATPLARDDIRHGQQYLESRQAGLGAAFVADVFAAFDQISLFPLGYGEVADGVRAIVTARFSYLVVYTTDGTAVEVIAVVHGSRSASAWQSRI